MSPIRVTFHVATAEEAEQLAEAIAHRADLLRTQSAATPEVRASLYLAAGRFYEVAAFHHDNAGRVLEGKSSHAFSAYMTRLAGIAGGQ